MTIGRRQFVTRLALGGAAVSVSPFLASCGVLPVVASPEEVPTNPFLDWFAVDEAMIAEVMSVLTRRGADTAELYFQYRRNHVQSFEGGEAGAPQIEVLTGVGLRVVQGDQFGFAYTEELTLPGMLAAAGTAASLLGTTGSTPPPPSYRFVSNAVAYEQHIDMEAIAAGSRQQLLRELDARARAVDPSVDDVLLRWSDSDERVLIATLDGRLLTDRRPLSRLSAQLLASRGGQQVSGYANVSARAGFDWYTDERLTALLGRATDRTLIQFEARQPPAGDMPVILAAGSSGILLHEAIGHSLEADFVRSGDSHFAGRLGELVASPEVSLVDEATLPQQRGALNIDDEGTVCGRTALIERGRLSSFLHDATTARQFGVESTASARRESFMHPPLPRMSCTFMENGPHAPEELLAAVDHGLIAESYTTGQVQLGANDFRFEVKNGWLVEGGKKTMPVRDFQIVGNGATILKDIAMVANDGELDAGGWTCGKLGQRVPVSHGMPSVLVPSLSVSADPVVS
jgi:TldD protein